MKKLLLPISVFCFVILLTFGASATWYDWQPMDGAPYTEDETTKIIDHVVYKICETDAVNVHYDVYDFFDSKEAFETVEEINIVPEIDGIKVKGIQCNFIYDDYLGHSHLYTDFHNYSVKKVTIPDTIEIIGDGFFSALDGLEELVVPASVKFSEDNYRAFDHMENLKRITFLGDVYNFPDKISTKLERVTICGSVKYIYARVFENSTSLKSFKVLGSIEERPEFIGGIGGRAFKNCTSLEEIVLPKEADDFKIYSSAFEGCTSLKSITLPETCGELTIGDDAFRGCTALETVTLPKKADSITIGYRAFRDCKNLTAVNNTDNITKIYGGAFRDCTSLKSFTISDKTTMIGKNAFYGCKNLKTVTVNSKTKAPKLYANVFAKTNSALTFTAKNATAAKSWKSALTKSGLKNAKVGYMHYV